VVEDETLLLLRDRGPHEALVVGRLATYVIWEAFVALCARDGWQITDGVAQADELIRGLRPAWPAMPVQTDEDQPLPVLWNPVAETVEDARFDPIAECSERLIETDEDRAVLPPRQVRHVLDEHRGWAQGLDDADE